MGETPNWQRPYPYRARVSFDDFDWEGERPLEIPSEDLVIYETHVRSFTRSDTSGVKQPGTYAALVEKIPYLKQLGINAVELMPVYEFDEFENSRIHPDTGEQLYNFWGYSTVGFLPPKPATRPPGSLGCRWMSSSNSLKLSTALVSR